MGAGLDAPAVDRKADGADQHHDGHAYANPKAPSHPVAVPVAAHDRNSQAFVAELQAVLQDLLEENARVVQSEVGACKRGS
jgi:hypothetical protein